MKSNKSNNRESKQISYKEKNWNLLQKNYIHVASDAIERMIEAVYAYKNMTPPPRRASDTNVNEITERFYKTYIMQKSHISLNHATRHVFIHELHEYYDTIGFIYLSIEEISEGLKLLSNIAELHSSMLDDISDKNSEKKEISCNRLIMV